MWKRRNLPRPPECTLQVSLTENNKGILNRARKTLKKTDSVLRAHINVLTAEQFVLGRIIYKLSNQFRSEKSMRGLKQIKSCLNRLDEVDVIGFLSKVYVNLCDGYDVFSEAPVFLPSRQSMEFSLARIMGTAGLLMQTSIYSRVTYLHAKQNTKLGNMIPQNLIIMSLTARIWMLCKSLCSHLCKCYNHLVPCLGVLQVTPVSWLPADETFPEDLDEWIKIEFGDSQSDVQNSGIDKEQININDVSLQADTSNHLNPENKSSETLGEPKKVDIKKMLIGLNEDIGEPIKRKRKHDLVTQIDQLMKSKSADGTIDLGEDIGEPIKRKAKNIVKVEKLVKANIAEEIVDLGASVIRKSKGNRKLGKSVAKKVEKGLATGTSTAAKKRKHSVDDDIVDMDKTCMVKGASRIFEQKRRKGKKKCLSVEDDVVDLNKVTLYTDTGATRKQKCMKRKKKLPMEGDIVNVNESDAFVGGETLTQGKGKHERTSVKTKNRHCGGLGSNIITDENMNNASNMDMGKYDLITNVEKHKQHCVQSLEGGKSSKTLPKQVQKYFTRNLPTINDLRQFNEELILKRKHNFEDKLGVDLNKKQKRKLARKIEMTIEKQKSQKSAENEKAIVVKVGKAVGQMMHTFCTEKHKQ